MTVIGDLWSEKPLVAGRWTLREVVQGKPMGHPTHAMLVHFPSALFPVAFALDIVSRINADLTVTRAAFYNIGFGLGFAALSAITGLIDYMPMIGGRSERNIRLGTLHMASQITATGLVAGSLAVRAFDYDATETPWAALILAGAGAIVIAIGNYLGGSLVYKQGVRVGEERRQAKQQESGTSAE
jgi:uncharacterized membrane protein